jgi:hypothetical protein
MKSQLVLSFFLLFHFYTNAQGINEIYASVFSFSYGTNTGGSGFVIEDSSNRQWIFTAAHVFDSTIKTGTIQKIYCSYGIDTFPVDIKIHIDRENDMAIGKVLSYKFNYGITPQPITFGISATMVYLGYPAHPEQKERVFSLNYFDKNTTPFVTFGHVNAIRNFGRKIEIFSSCVSMPGMSGGLACIIDTKGNFIPVGVISASMYSEEITNLYFIDSENKTSKLVETLQYRTKVPSAISIAHYVDFNSEIYKLTQLGY